MQVNVPQDLADLRMLLLSGGISLPGRLRRIVEIGLMRPDVIAFGTAAQIAKACGVSASTVMRLPAPLGLTSLRQLRRLFQHDLARRHRAGGTMSSDAAANPNVLNDAKRSL